MLCSMEGTATFKYAQGAWQELGEQAAALADERRAFRRAMRLIRRGAALATAQPSGVLVRLERP